MIPKRSAAQIACVRARTRAAVMRLTLPPTGTRGNQTLLDSGNLVQAPVKRLVFFFVSLLGSWVFFCFLFLVFVWSLVLCWSPQCLVWFCLWFGLAALRRPVSLSRGACGAAVAALFSWSARKTCRCFHFSEFAQKNQSSRSLSHKSSELSGRQMVVRAILGQILRAERSPNLSSECGSQLCGSNQVSPAFVKFRPALRCSCRCHHVCRPVEDFLRGGACSSPAARTVAGVSFTFPWCSRKCHHGVPLLGRRHSQRLRGFRLVGRGSEGHSA